MPKQKAILLGVKADRPYFGQWISVSERQKWILQAICQPNHVVLTDEIEVEVRFPNDGREKFFLTCDSVISGGSFIRINLLKKIEGVNVLNIFLYEKV